MNNNFYKEFEKRYRGSRELIKSRLLIYQPLVELVKGFDPEPTAIDLGCGRGEWLELISEMGFNAYGVDLDESMLEYCIDKGLNVREADAIETIESLENGSQAIVSAFHVVEHISFNNLQILVKEALRVLKPGGLLIMETPNPENITVATKNFYIDPTHIKPIPSELLSFLPEYHGYKRVKVMGLQESKELAQSPGASLSDVISGVSPDYAVLAQKNADPDILARFEDVFNKNYGLTLATLAERHDKQIYYTIDQVGEWAQKAEKTAESTQKLAQEAVSKAQKAQVLAKAAQAQAHQFHAQLNAVYNSYSWRVTWPLRKIVDIARWSVNLPMRLIKWMIHLPGNLVAWLMSFAIKRGSLRVKLLYRINKHPWLKARLTSIGQNRGVLPEDNFPENENTLLVSQNHNQSFNEQEADLEHMTPTARQIYHDLKKAVEQRQKERV